MVVLSGRLLCEVLQLLCDNKKVGVVAPDRWMWCVRACSYLQRPWRGGPDVR
jgi:hypothetical protein